MTSDDTRITLPTVRLRNSRFDIRIDTGELLFPAIVLLSCSAYYAETRGIPAESMLYAEPLLYATASLAVITMFGHVVSVDIGADGGREQPSSDSTKSVVWGVENAVAEREHPRKEKTTTDLDRDETDVNAEETDTGTYFHVRSAIGLVALSTGYVLSLYLVPFVFGTASFLAASVYLFGERDRFRILGYSVGITLLLWLVFINWLQVPLP
jgi:hypothetical protein